MTYTTSVLAKSCIGYWPMGDYGPDLSDSSLLASNLVRSGGLKNVRQVDYLLPSVAPHTGQQGAYRAVAGVAPATRLTPFSVVVWARAGSIGASKFCSTRTPGDFSFSMGMQSTGILQFDIGNGAAWLANPASTWYAVHAQDWHMYAACLSAAGWTQYVDDAQIGSAAVALGTGVLWDATHRMTAFARDSVGTEGFTGDLCRLSAHSVQLSATDIHDLWVAGFPGAVFTSGGATPATPVDELSAQILASVRKTYVAP